MNNILITNPDVAEGYKGMLIDLDLAKTIGSERSGAKHMTGTKLFMAIGVLQGNPHTYRHDLESFFYVLLWLCAEQSWKNGLGGKEKAPRASWFDDWLSKEPEKVALDKEGQMSVRGVRRFTSLFPASLDSVKELCLELRSFLFGSTADIYLETPELEDDLYNPILEAFEKTIRRLAGPESENSFPR